MPGPSGQHALLVVTDPSGHRAKVGIQAVPFTMGRQIDNQLVLRDTRTSRYHARIVYEGGAYVLEDVQSRHGVFVNGSKVERKALKDGDRIDFGFPDSYQLVFQLAAEGMERLLGRVSPNESPAPLMGAPGAENLAKLRAVLEVARALESSFSTDGVLAAVVDAALAVTGTERGFLLLRDGEDLEMRVARDRFGARLAEADLRVPRNLIHRALHNRRQLLSMNFDPQSSAPLEHSVADLDLRAVVCVPLVRVRVGGSQETSTVSAANDTVGVLYMDSRLSGADLSAGNRELLETLALEASTVLENARLLEEERAKQRIEQELSVARQIQQNLLPRELPGEGWFRAAGSSVPTYQVGGDYFDVIRVDDSSYATVVADVSGKGVSSALLASLLQGAFFAASVGGAVINRVMERVNQFLESRAEGDKYATIFYCVIHRTGAIQYINAGHCSPLLISRDGRIEKLSSTGLPVGLFGEATYPHQERQLSPGDRILIYSDGVSEARSESGEFFGASRLREAVKQHADADAHTLHEAIHQAVQEFTAGVEPADDVTIVVLQYEG